MSSYTHHSKKSKTIADEILGYCLLDVDDSAVKQLSDGVDYAAGAVAVPSEATGALIIFKTLSTGGKTYFTLHEDPPEPVDDKGDLVYETEWVEYELYIGKTSQSSGHLNEWRDCKTRCNSAHTARLEVTYIRYRG